MVRRAEPRRRRDLPPTDRSEGIAVATRGEPELGLIRHGGSGRKADGGRGRGGGGEEAEAVAGTGQVFEIGRAHV